MKKFCNKQLVRAAVVALFSGVLFLAGCANVNPTNPQTPYPAPPAEPAKQASQYKVTYHYNDTDQVQLSANNFVLKVGDKLILQPAPGLTQNTHFTSSGEYFFGDIFKQDTDQKESGQVVFTAIKPGKGKLQIIPNSNDTARAADLWVTVQ